MTDLTKLAQGFGFIETRARSLSGLTEKAAQMPPPPGSAGSGEYAPAPRAAGPDGILGNADDTFGRHRGGFVTQEILNGWKENPYIGGDQEFRSELQYYAL